MSGQCSCTILWTNGTVSVSTCVCFVTYCGIIIICGVLMFVVILCQLTHNVSVYKLKTVHLYTIWNLQIKVLMKMPFLGKPWKSMPTKINDFTVHHCIFVIVDDECWLMKWHCWLYLFWKSNSCLEEVFIDNPSDIHVPFTHVLC